MNAVVAATNRFSSSQLPPCIQLSDNGLIAKYCGGAKTDYILAVCEIPQLVFKGRLIRCSGILFIGVCLPQAIREPKQPPWKDSFVWLIGCGLTKLYEGGKFGPETRDHIPVGAVVSIEKQPNEKALRFRVNGKDPVDKRTGEPFGWRPTGLSSEDFDALVGCAEFYKQNEGDAVEIV